MKLQDFQVSQQKLEEMMIQQGFDVYSVVSSKEWELVKNIIKSSIELVLEKRVQVLEKQSTREMALYYSGLEDGARLVDKQILQVIQASENIKNQKKQMNELQEDLK